MEDKEGRYQEFTPATVMQVSHEVDQGTADPIDARRLLELFCQSPTPELIAHLRARIEDYLHGKADTLDAALGLVRKTRGQPKADERKGVSLALCLLEMRLAGRPYQTAVDIIAGEKHVGTTTVKDAWRDHKEAARSVFLLRVATTGRKLTESEREAINAICK